MTNTFKRNQTVAYRNGQIEARVERVHRDGTYTIKACFHLEAGKRVGGWLGYRYRVSPAILRAAGGR